MKNKLIWLIMALFFLGIQSWFFYIMVKYPYLGINVEQNSQEQWAIVSFDKYSGSLRLDLKAGDIVVAVNGEDPGEHDSIAKWHAIEQTDSIRISRDGSEILIDTRQISDSAVVGIYPLIGETICLFMALLLKIKIRQSKSALYLSFVFLCCGAVFMSLGPSIRADLLGRLLINYSLMALPIIFLHFLTVFFKEKGGLRLPVKYIGFLYGGILFNIVLRTCVFMPGAPKELNKLSSKITLFLFLIGFICDFVILSYVYFKYRKANSIMSTIIRTVRLFFLVSFFPIVVLSFIPRILFDTEWVNAYYTGWFVLLFPLSFAYLIGTRQLYDVHIVFRRILYTVIISLLPSLILVGLVASLFTEEDSVKRLALIFIFNLIVFSVVLYSLEYITTKLEAILFPQKYQLRTALKKISRNLGTISSFHELKELVLVDIVNTLQVYGGAIVFNYSQSQEIISEGEIDLAEVERLSASGMPEHPSYTSFEINHEKEHTSHLVMTRKKTGTRLGLEEIQWLNLIISYLGVSLENVYLIRKLTLKLEQLAAQIPNEKAANDFLWFRKLTFELQEKERFRIATDIHDTTMQDLFFLKRRLAALLENHVFEKEVKEQMRSIIEYVEVINTNLRQNCFELHPYLLQEIGLLHTIRKVIETERPFCPFDIVFQADEQVEAGIRDLDTKRHLFRIFQELLNNAKKHSAASAVKITLAMEAHVLTLTYGDDGIGFDNKRPAEREVGSSGVGMEQMNSRILYLNGRMDVSTAPGRGVRIRITIPLKEVMSA